MSTWPGPMPNDLAQNSPGSHCASAVHGVPTRCCAMSGVVPGGAGGGGGVGCVVVPPSTALGTDCVGAPGSAGPAGSPVLTPMTSNEQPATQAPNTAATIQPARMPAEGASGVPTKSPGFTRLRREKPG